MLRVVLDAEAFEQDAGVLETPELVFVQALVAETALKDSPKPFC